MPISRFWKKAGYAPTYLRQTKNDLTGEHTTIMLKEMNKFYLTHLSYRLIGNSALVVTGFAYYIIKRNDTSNDSIFQWSGYGRIRIHLGPWIRIPNANPDPEI